MFRFPIGYMVTYIFTLSYQMNYTYNVQKLFLTPN